jgi:catechol 2,3-dioxygenase-like lactoylglutathione lyase family enzyme
MQRQRCDLAAWEEIGMPAIETPGRLQLALNVRNLDEAIAFYGRMFGAKPHKVRPGYANFAIENPPLKLVLIEQPDTTADRALNHLGVEVFSTQEVVRQTQRFSAEGMPVTIEEGVDCCYATQDKVWVDSPDGLRWEVYTVTDDRLQELTFIEPGPGACGPDGACGCS